MVRVRVRVKVRDKVRELILGADRINYRRSKEFYSNKTKMISIIVIVII